MLLKKNEQAPDLDTDGVSKKAATGILLGILALVFLAYLGTLWFQFVLDDRYLIVENTWLRSWHYLPRYFSRDIWAVRHPTLHGSFYRPLFLLLFRFEYMAFGLKPWGWHLVTVLAHVGVTLLLYYLAVGLLKDRVAGLFAALIFGLYPIHVEAAAWATGITESLLTLFVIGSFLFYLRKRSEPPRARIYLVASLTLYALALLSKEIAVVLPLIIFGSEWVWSEAPAGRERKSARSELPHEAQAAMTLQDSPKHENDPSPSHPLPLSPLPRGEGKGGGEWGEGSGPTLPSRSQSFALRQAAKGLRAHVRRFSSAFAAAPPYLAVSVAYVGLRRAALGGFQNPGISLSFRSVVLTWPSELWFYIRHLVWPVGLSSIYEMDYVAHPGVRNFLLPSLGVLLAAAGLWIASRRSQKAALAALWLVLPILPALNLWVLPEGHFVADRYLHLPSVGFAMLAALGLRQLRFGSLRLLGQPAPQIALALILAVALSTGVTQESAYFADPSAFYTHIAATTMRDGHGKVNLAGLLGEQGHLDEALKLYLEDWQTESDNWNVNYNIGYVYYLKDDLPDAERYLTRAVQIEPGHPESLFYLGLTKFKMGDTKTAAAAVEQAISLRPEGEHYHFALGVILKTQGNLPQALSEFRAAVEVDPGDAAARQQAAEVEATLAGQGAGANATPPKVAK